MGSLWSVGCIYLGVWDISKMLNAKALVLLTTVYHKHPFRPRMQDRYHRYISSNGLVSVKQLSHTSLTIRAACTSSLQSGLALKESAARRLTHSWWCWVSLSWCFVKNSRVQRHSPLRDEALISVQAACRRLFVHCNLNR